MVCHEGGETALCDTCLSSYHVSCHQPPLRAVPRCVVQCQAALLLVKNISYSLQDLLYYVYHMFGVRCSAHCNLFLQQMPLRWFVNIC